MHIRSKTTEIRYPLCQIYIPIEPLLLTWIKFDPCMDTWIHPSWMWDEITNPFQNFNGATVEVWRWIIDVIPHFSVHVITYLSPRYAFSLYAVTGSHKKVSFKVIAIAPLSMCLQTPHCNFPVDQIEFQLRAFTDSAVRISNLYGYAELNWHNLISRSSMHLDCALRYTDIAQ